MSTTGEIHRGASRRLVLSGPLLGVLTFLTEVFLLIVIGGWILPLALLKFLIPVPAIQRSLSRASVWIARRWAASNRFALQLLLGPQWRLQWNAKLDPAKSYLLICNHQSWADIVTLFYLFHGHAPFPRFFLKRELLWVPIIGLVCWGMDFPFMKRHSKQAIAKNPQLRNEDLETTRRTCEIYRTQPVTVVNFLEGTRNSPAKHAAMASPFRRLLRPKSAGLSFMLNAMGEQFDGIIDVTMAYQPVAGDVAWSWLCGHQRRLAIHVELLSIPPEMMQGNYDSDPEFRAQFQDWVNQLWARKDARLDAMIER